MIRYEHWPEAKVLQRVRLRQDHTPTGRTRHYDDERLLPPPAELVLCRYDSLRQLTTAKPARKHVTYYLFYLDDSGAEMTDLAPVSLDDGLAQAEGEFGIKPEEWELIGDDTPL